ncbi:MAG TPA: VOC family protein [Planctomycetota bacterium]|nr:VOC family protein [Planctomycetota bacterium]
MFQGGNATVYVRDMDRAVAFYSKTLGFRLTKRFENFWAEVDAGAGLTIGLHPAGHGMEPGTKGGVQVGLIAAKPLEEIVKTLTGRGVAFEGPIVDGGEAGRFVSFADPDGNPIYVWEQTALSKAEGREAAATKSGAR